MRKRFHVKITAEDIRKADVMRVKRYEMWDAGLRTPEWMHLVHTDPLAYAIKRDNPTAQVDVSYYGVIIDGALYDLSRPAQQFVEDYDGFVPVGPSSFYLSQVPDVQIDNFGTPHVAPPVEQ